MMDYSQKSVYQNANSAPKIMNNHENSSQENEFETAY